MKEGSLAITLHLRQPWPPEKRGMIVDTLKATTRLRIYGYPDGHWMDWRTQTGRRHFSAAEQTEHLQAELQTLHHDGQQVVAGHKAFVRKIAGSLRSLIYWQIRKDGSLNPSYNPLLLRLAARKNLPLPVFAMPDDRATRPEIVSQAEIHVINNFPTVGKLFPGQSLMDLQAWMNMPISTERFAGLLSGAEKELAVKDIIGDVANTMGGAHYDEDVPEQLDRLRNFGAYNQGFVDQFLVMVADTILKLGVFVLK
jgi:hypothetical protein